MEGLKLGEREGADPARGRNGSSQDDAHSLRDGCLGELRRLEYKEGAQSDKLGLMLPEQSPWETVRVFLGAELGCPWEGL